MSKSEEFRKKIQERRYDGTAKHRRTLDIIKDTKEEFKDALSRLGRGDNDQEQRAPVHEDERIMRRRITRTGPKHNP